MPALNLLRICRLYARVARARSAVGHKITYGLGAGGMDPSSPLPSDAAHKCDCSGFALAWAFGLSRKPKATRNWWLETTRVYQDATSKKPQVFVRIDKPVAGCAVVYPDRNGGEGHCGLVTDVAFGPHGEVVRLTGIDCSSGRSRATGEAINERDLTFFLASSPVFVLLKEDFN